MLNQYVLNTQRLLQNPSAPTSLYNPVDLTAYINEGRGRLAGFGECIRVLGTLALVAGTRFYPFSSIVLPGSPPVNGVQGVINVRNAWYTVGTGYKFVRQRAFEWFTVYELNNPVAGNNQGPPAVWTQYGQGTQPQPSGQASGGTLGVSPLPDQGYSLLLDCVCYPIVLNQDSDPEAIPYLWTDAVQFYAAYKALLAAQSTARQADADRMLSRYQTYVQEAREYATPSALPGIYPQSADPTMPNKLGLQARGGGG